MRTARHTSATTVAPAPPTEPEAEAAIPPEIDAVLERRLGELRPLHEEYTQLLSYRELAAASLGDGDEKTQPRRATPGAARNAILSALAEGPRTGTQLAEQLGLSSGTLRYNLRRLSRTGVIVESCRGDTYSYSLASSEADGP